MQKEILKFDSSSVMEGMVSIRAVIKARETGKSKKCFSTEKNATQKRGSSLF